MRAGVSGPVAWKAWKGYRDWWRRARGDPGGQPSIEDVARDLALGHYPIRELSVVKIASVFETFVQCWALNMLLASLEAGVQLSPKHEELAKDFSPIHTPNKLAPVVPGIFNTFADISSKLEHLPHIKTHPTTGAALEEPLTPDLNSHRAILFWREFRNCLVHRAGLISLGFYNRNNQFFEAMREPYESVLRPLKAMTRLQIPQQVFYAMVSVHYRAAIFLNERLQETSGRRRGTIYLPEAGVEEPTSFDPALKSLPLLVEGDHSESLRWVEDESYRDDLARAVAAARR